MVDVFDALTSARSYKEAWTFENARDYIAHGRGKDFDPRLVDVFLENFQAFQECVTRSAPEADGGSET